MNVHDRGTMKWTSLMLPEHVELLQEVFTEYVDKPILDEQKQMEIDQILKYGLAHQTILKITYYQKGDVLTVKSKLKKIDQWKGFIILANESGIPILLGHIIDVEIVEN